MGKLIDLTGQRFGRLIVTGRAASNGCGHHAKWNCVCDCGNQKDVVGKDLRTGKTTSCGCYSREKIHEMFFMDVIGQRFGRLVVLKDLSPRINTSGRKRAMVLCKCDCGNEIAVMKESVTGGTTKSCGCLQKERAAEVQTVHGGASSRLYNVWAAMLRRCENSNSGDYHNYGGRGIKVCEEWHRFENFREWGLANGYDEESKRGQCTIDRIDNNAGYCPQNCRWVDTATQNNNKRSTHFLTYNGETHSITEWAKTAGINREALNARINKYKWPTEKALTIPCRKKLESGENHARV